MELDWDHLYLGLAALISTKSKDPTTKCGAVIVSHDNHIISLGFNGFPMRVHDTLARLQDRETKLKLTIHAEANALHFAEQPLSGASLYAWPFMTCSKCAADAIQRNIARVIVPYLAPETDLYRRWERDIVLAKELYVEAGMELVLVALKVDVSLVQKIFSDLVQLF